MTSADWRGGAQCLGIGWAEQENALAREQGVQGTLDDLATLGELGGEVLSELLQLLDRCGHRDSLVVGGERAARTSGGAPAAERVLPRSLPDLVPAAPY